MTFSRRSKCASSCHRWSIPTSLAQEISVYSPAALWLLIRILTMCIYLYVYIYIYIYIIYIYMMFVCVVYAPKTARKNAFTSLTIIYIHGHKPSYWVSARRADIAAWTCRGAWQCIPRVEPESIGSSMSRAKQKAGNTYGIAEITFTNNWHKYDCWILEGWI